jgi:pseudomonalisin
LTLVAVLLSAQAAWAQERVELRGAVSRLATDARRVDRGDPQDVLDMSIALALPRPGEVDALIAEQQRPGSPVYHRWLTPADFAARFGPPAAQYDALAQWLRNQGFRVRAWENRLRIDFSGTVGAVERSFGVRMNYYSHRGAIHLANANPPLVPAQFAGSVRFMRLNTFPLARPVVHLVGSSGTFDTMAPADLVTAYNGWPVLDRGITGAGQTIAVVARSDFNSSDITLFQQQFGITALAPVKVFPAGNPGVGASNGVCRNVRNRSHCIQSEEGEVVLDVEWANAMAPGATVLVDIAGTDIDQSFFDIVNHHPEAKVITMSFDACERLDSSDHLLFGPAYAQAAAQGQSVLVASGDDGADDCQDGNAAAVNVLASDANVTAVGGTALDPAFDASGNATGYASETVWNDGYGASGGGASVLVPKPSYQFAPGVPADGARDVPDVSLLASPLTLGYVTVVGGQFAIVGGTSAAAPAWAGIVALLNASTPSGASGALNHRLYALARQQYASGTGPFHDIVTGSNGFNGLTGFNAGVGYDLASGLGTPDVDRLSRAFAHSGCAGDCNGDGTVTVNEIMTGVNIVLEGSPVAACEAADANGDGSVTVDELLQAVGRALNGC